MSNDGRMELQAMIVKLTEQKDGAYQERDKCVALVAAMAVKLGYSAWLGWHDPKDESWDDDWRRIVFVELPTGQISWHIHDSEVKLFLFLPNYGIRMPNGTVVVVGRQHAWDGHSTEEKYERMQNYGSEIAVR